MNPSLDVAFLPAELKTDALRDRAVVVVDVLRATTTIVNALHHGISRVIPAPSIERARELHEQLGEGSLMGGERGGRKVDGFHCGNSPPEYESPAVRGKTLILATTNGTVAMEQCRQAKVILIGAFINIAVVAERLKSEPAISILCSGTDRHITSEDVLFAGGLTEKLTELVPDLALDDSAKIALHHWQVVQQAMKDENRELADFFRTARGGKNLVRIGHDHDVSFAAQMNTVPQVPVLDPENWSIQLSTVNAD